MARILAIDYGLKRSGIAVTDPNRIIAHPLRTVPTGELLDFLEQYLRKEPVACVVVGLPPEGGGPHRNHRPAVVAFVRRLRRRLAIPVETEDESFTSREAMEVMLRAGARRTQRQRKENIDKISASLILERYLERKKTP